MKHLIINADDYGYSSLFNKKILELIEKNFVSSTSVMINSIDTLQKTQVEKLIALAESHKCSIGLHLEFININFQQEIQKQYKKFFTVLGRYPDHLDLHKPTYLQEAYPIIMQFAKEKNIPCRNHGFFTEGVKQVNYPALNGTSMSLDELKRSMVGFQDDAFYEIFFHPGIYDPASKSSLNREREKDAEKIEALQPFLKENNIKVINYAQFSHHIS